MNDLDSLRAEERVLVTFARLTMDIYAATHSPRSYEMAHEAMVRAEALRHEAERLRRRKRNVANA